jgi:integrase
VDSEPVDMASQAWSVARWLQFWLGSVQLRPSTVNSYRQHVCRYLIPVLGRLRLDELTVHRVQACFDLLARRRAGTGARISPATVDRIRATLRSALNTAVREGVMAANPMRSVKVIHPVRPHPVVWTDERVAEWRRTGVRPPVAVWTLAQTARFLDAVKDDRLAGVWWLIALRGLRRGEVTGLRRADLDGAAKELSVHRQVVALPGVLYTGPPKSRAGNRTVALDGECARVFTTNWPARPTTYSSTATSRRPAAMPAPVSAGPMTRARRCSVTPTADQYGRSTSATSFAN